MKAQCAVRPTAQTTSTQIVTRRTSPENSSRESCAAQHPHVRELFSGEVRRVTIWVLVVCAVGLTAHWAFMFWHQQHLRNLPEVLPWSPEAKNRLVSKALYLVMGSSILG